MAYDANASDTQQRSASVLRVIQAFFKNSKRSAGKHVTHFRRKRSGERLLEQRGNHIHGALADFQDHVADKAVRDDDVRAAIEQIASFHVSEKIQIKPAQTRQRLASGLGALMRFRTV